MAFFDKSAHKSSPCVRMQSSTCIVQAAVAERFSLMSYRSEHTLLRGEGGKETHRSGCGWGSSGDAHQILQLVEGDNGHVFPRGNVYGCSNQFCSFLTGPEDGLNGYVGHAV